MDSVHFKNLFIPTTLILGCDKLQNKNSVVVQVGMVDFVKYRTFGAFWEDIMNKI